MSRAEDDALIDQVSPHRLTNRQLLERIARGITRTENLVSAASDYMATALDGLDSQLADLQTRLQADAQALADALAGVAAGQADTAALEAAAARVQATADLVGSLDRPSVVVDPEQPDVDPTPIPPADNGGQDTPADPGTGGDTPADPGTGDTPAPGDTPVDPGSSDTADPSDPNAPTQ